MIEELIYSNLSTATSVTALVVDRIYPLLMPQDPTLPAVTYQRISDNPINSLSGHGGLDNPRIQIDCWATSYSGVKTLSNAVIKAMDSSTAYKSLRMSDQDLYEDGTEIYRVSMDFSCWFKST
jgi:hypothetical protein